METLSEYMLRRFCSAYPTVPITLSKVKAYLDTVDDWRELDDSHLALLYNFNLKKQKGNNYEKFKFQSYQVFGLCCSVGKYGFALCTARILAKHRRRTYVWSCW